MLSRLSDPALMRTVRLLAVCLIAWLIVQGSGQAASAAEPSDTRVLRLAPDADLRDPWPAMRVMTGSDIMTVDAAEEAWANGRFHTTDRYPWSNIGRQDGPVWLRLSIEVAPAAMGRRMITVDYPSLDEMLWWAIDPRGRTVALGSTGDYQLLDARAVTSRMLALPVDFDLAGEWTLYGRVITTSTVIVPTSIAQPDRLYQADSREILAQGVLLGIFLCLILYAGGQWLVSREPIFLGYALSVGAHACFFLAFWGVGPLHLWSDSDWLTRNILPAAAQLWVLAATQFYIDVFGLRGRPHRLRRMLDLIGAVAAAGLLASVLGLVGYGAAQTWCTVTVVLPMLVIVPAAVVRLRQGDRAMRVLLPGLLVYAASCFITAALMRGLIGAHGWATHAMQIGSIAEVIAWILVLVARSTEQREAAERVRAERDVMHSLAHTDVLTGLKNRRGLLDALHHIGSGPMAADRRLAVFMIDLDGFKPINDRYGHEVGDQVLQVVARRLRASVREQDTVARLGGDEFVVVVADLPDQASALQEVRRQLQAGFERPVHVGEMVCPIRASIGHALRTDPGEDLDALMRRADEVMYVIKHSRDLEAVSI